MLELEPYWVDFNTAIALRGQLEENKEHDKMMKKYDDDAKHISKGSSKGYKQSSSLSDKLRNATSIDDIIRQRNNAIKEKVNENR